MERAAAKPPGVDPMARRPHRRGQAVRCVALSVVGRRSCRQSEDEMITLYGFGRIVREGLGETKDLRVQWALEEFGLPYRVHAIDHTGGEHTGEAYSRISPFH